MAIIQLLIQLIPLIKSLVALFVKTPEEKRLQLITNVHAAIKDPKLAAGDTSDLENLIKKGK